MIKEKLKELGKALLASLVVILIVFVPVGLSISIYYISILFFNSSPHNLESFITGSIYGSVCMFIFFMYLLISKRFRFDENAENTEQEN